MTGDIVTKKLGKIWFAENDLLAIYGVGDTEQSALRELQEHFEYYKSYYGSCPDETLTEQGRKLKELFIK